MKTVIFLEIDGYNVVTGFSEPAIDRFETEKSIKKNLEELPEAVEIVALSKKIVKQKNIISNAASFVKSEKLKDPENQDSKLISSNELAINKAYEAARTYEEEIKDQALILSAKKVRMMQDQAVYFEPKNGEEIISDELYSELSLMSGENKKLSIKVFGGVVSDPVLVPDYKGKEYYLKQGSSWIKSEILELGVDKPEYSKFTEELTLEEKKEIAEQFEIDRINVLTAEQKQFEFNCKKTEVMAQSVNLRSELEITGANTVEALSESQNFYNTEIEKLKLIYGI